MLALLCIAIQLAVDVLRAAGVLLVPRTALIAENLFLRRQLALYQERNVNPRRIGRATRIALVFLSRFFNWRDVLVCVRPRTLISWHRAGFRALWRWKCRPGRPPIPIGVQRLIRDMARDNPIWGEERIANEQLLKLGIHVSPRTVRKYMPQRAPGRPRGDQRWATFLRNHAQAIIACDFLVTFTASFRMLYVFVVIEHRTKKLVHIHVTQHPNANWTLQQLREVIGGEAKYSYLLHDGDSIFAKHLDQSIAALGVTVLKSPPNSPKANAICERVIGTIRRECLDWMIPISESHLRTILREWVGHDNHARPHMALGPGIPDPPAVSTSTQHLKPLTCSRDTTKVRARPVLGGLHYEYSWAPVATDWPD